MTEKAGMDISEIEFDQLLTKGFLKKIPVFGSAIREKCMEFMFRDSMFLKKMNNFLSALPEYSDNHISDNAFMSDQKLQKRVAEFLVVNIYRMDALDKTEMLSSAFFAFITQDINFSQLRKLAAAINIAFIEDLKAFITSQDTNFSLIQAGLIETVQDTDENNNVTELGNLFIRFC